MTNCTGETGICSRCISGYWGGLCSDICPRHCLGNRCDQINGHCIDGCISGRHGLTCIETCSSRCLGSLCDPKTGNCSTGCIDNWKGTRCDVPFIQSPDSNDTTYIYTAIAIICVLIIAMAIGLFLRHRFKPLESQGKQEMTELPTVSDFQPPVNDTTLYQELQHSTYASLYE
uniref:Multiple epidermal growth factor-like domains protein 10 n=1 Tax=Crassostrea virginica TaxID=6565 RepID=A0A8B8BIR9_CRAVI|nr:multiple epidermal growth factor-like domains protein 10 [Crassostrea virginica]